MIYFTGLDSFIEAVYLESEGLETRVGHSNIHVNPDNTTYLTGKTIIINILDYPKEKIQELLKNRCIVISRVSCDIPEVLVQPYILRPNFYIMWNGKQLGWEGSSFQEFQEYIVGEDHCSLDFENISIYLPKIKGCGGVMDSLGNMTCLGWALQQIGVNIKIDTPFVDLDIIKTKKTRF